MHEQAREVYNELRKKGFKGEKLVRKMIELGKVLAAKADKQGNDEVRKLALELLENAATAATSEGLRSLAIQARSAATVARAAQRRKRPQSLGSAEGAAEPAPEAPCDSAPAAEQGAATRSRPAS